MCGKITSKQEKNPLSVIKALTKITRTFKQSDLQFHWSFLHMQRSDWLHFCVITPHFITSSIKFSSLLEINESVLWLTDFWYQRSIGAFNWLKIWPTSYHLTLLFIAIFGNFFRKSGNAFNSIKQSTAALGVSQWGSSQDVFSFFISGSHSSQLSSASCSRSHSFRAGNRDCWLQRCVSWALFLGKAQKGPDIEGKNEFSK